MDEQRWACKAVYILYQHHWLVEKEWVWLDTGTNMMHAFSQFSCYIAVFKLARSTFQNGGDLPWSGECILEFVKDASLGIRSNCSTNKNNVANWADMRVRTTCVNKFLMIRLLFFHQELSNLATCRQPRRKFLRVRHNCARQWFQLPVFPTRVIYWKCKLSANGN